MLAAQRHSHRPPFCRLPAIKERAQGSKPQVAPAVHTGSFALSFLWRHRWGTPPVGPAEPPPHPGCVPAFSERAVPEQGQGVICSYIRGISRGLVLDKGRGAGRGEGRGEGRAWHAARGGVRRGGGARGGGGEQGCVVQRGHQVGSRQPSQEPGRHPHPSPCRHQDPQPQYGTHTPPSTPSPPCPLHCPPASLCPWGSLSHPALCLILPHAKIPSPSTACAHNPPHRPPGPLLACLCHWGSSLIQLCACSCAVRIACALPPCSLLIMLGAGIGLPPVCSPRWMSKHVSFWTSCLHWAWHHLVPSCSPLACCSQDRCQCNMAHVALQSWALPAVRAFPQLLSNVFFPAAMGYNQGARSGGEHCVEAPPPQLAQHVVLCDASMPGLLPGPARRMHMHNACACAVRWCEGTT